MPVQTLVHDIVADRSHIEGITVSGGEPLEQPQALLALLNGVRDETSLSVILFSGHTLGEITRSAVGREITTLVDVLIAGPYMSSLGMAHGLRGSSNQRIHLMTGRYTLSQLESTPTAEIHIDPNGVLSLSGIDPPGAASRETAQSEQHELKHEWPGIHGDVVQGEPT